MSARAKKVSNVSRIPQKVWKNMSKADQQIIIDLRDKGLQVKVPKNAVSPANGKGKANKRQKGKKKFDGAHDFNPKKAADKPFPIAKAINFEQKDLLTVQTDFVINALNEVMLAHIGYLGGLGLFSDSNTTGIPLPGATFLPAIAYLFGGIQSIMNGGVVAISKMPRVFHDLTCALKPKSVKFGKFAKASYGWNTFAQTDSLSGLNVGDGMFALTIPNVGGDNGAYNNPLLLNPALANGNEEMYASYLKAVGDLSVSGFLQVVSIDIPSVMDKDVSSYSRRYRFNGLAPVPTNGTYGDAENEVKILSRMYAAFVDYVQPDIRVPRDLVVVSGGPQMALWPCSSTFISHFNRVPPVFKQVDFEEIYTLVVMMISLAKEKAQQFAPESAEAQPFTFTQQDFRIVLRQACLNVFKDTQWLAQFESYVQFDGTTNCFVPFLVTGGTAARSIFGNLLLPQLIVENLNALRGRNFGIPGKSSKVSGSSYIPILGHYYQDTEFIPQFQLQNGTYVNLFATGSQSAIRLTDMFLGAGPSYVDPNSDWYQSILSDINFHMEKLTQYTVPLKQVLSDVGPAGMGVLCVTKVQLGSDVEAMAKRRTMRVSAALGNCANSRGEKVETVLDPSRKNSGSEMIVKIIPPASVVSLNTTNITSMVPTTSELDQLYQTLITPVIRNNDTEDALNTTMYMTETREVCVSQVSSVGQTFAAGVFASLHRYAGLCVTGVAKEVNNEYTQLMMSLAEHSKGGFLGALLTGVGEALGIPPQIASAVGAALPI